ncbi:MAG: SUMF1/EgtB/PvdO family nonheme iron enzyme [Blastocatellales bacterium]
MTSNSSPQNTATPRPTVFVSYAHQDADFASRLIADLDAAGHACWIDTNSIKGGDEWIGAIAEGISESYAFVVIVTQKALESRWVRDEILWARNEDKPIIPLILENVLRDKWFFLLNSVQGVTLLDGDYAAALPKLLRSLPAPTFPETGFDQPRKTYLNRLRLEDLLNAEKYTPMGGSSEQRQSRVEMRAVFELLPMMKDHQPPREPKRFENAVEEIRRIRRAVLLGEPGGGKTTTIWKLAADLVAEAAQDREAPIPLLIRLGRWTDADQPLNDFIASQLGDLGASLDLLLDEKRAALLLDGLNELPAGQRDIKYPQVRRLIEQHPALLAVVSCRELDYTDDLGFDRINITPLDPLRIREFAGRYLGAEKGEALFWRLAGGDDVRTLWEVWQKAGATFELFWTATDIPRENPNVYGATSGEQDRVWKEKVRGKHTLMELARNPYMLLMLTSVYAEQGELPENRGELFRLFVETLLKRERIAEDEQAALTDGLASVAYRMQIRRADGDAGDALTVRPKDAVNAILGERLLYLAGSASILNSGDQVRFTHQLLQEYFTAKFMDGEIRAGRLKASGIWPTDRWWERTNWEEAAILLAGLYSNDCSRVVEWVAEANPEVAAQCVVRGGAALADATCERLRSKWIPRLTDLKHDPDAKARAAIGRALGLTGWDNRKGVGIVRGANGVALPDIDPVEIPGGEFQYGDNSDYAAKPQKLTLPTFHISRYPVTYAQFQTFLDDPEGFADPRWFAGLAASDDERRINEQYFKFANHPREMVNWYQAMAFCRWLSWRRGGGYDLKKVDEWAVRLPTEFEWEKAARGVDGRIYPYKGDYDTAKGNTDDVIGQTSAVGIFPNGASPYGVMDMSGNVWEWCLSNYDKPALDARKENVRTKDTRVLRGGAWFYDLIDARAVSRFNYFTPFDRNYLIGFRLVVVLRPPSLLL